MAKSSSKGYSAGGGKKWLVAIALVVLVAIAVVVVLICIPPNTYNAIQTLNRTTNSSFLVDSSKEQEDFINLRDKIEAVPKFQAYSEELNDIAWVATAVDEILEFYNDNIIFANNNKNLKKNFKPIKNNLNKAKEIQKKLASSLSKMKEIARESDSMRNAIIDFRADFIRWMKANQKAVAALNSAYSGSMGNILENNTASRLILNTVDQMFEDVISSFEKTKEEDKKGTDLKTDYYKAELSTIIFGRFVLENLTETFDSPIKYYYFDEEIKAKFDKFERFFEVYKLKDLSSVLASAQKVGGRIDFTKTFEGVEDKEGLYETVKSIIGGNYGD